MKFKLDIKGTEIIKEATSKVVKQLQQDLQAVAKNLAKQTQQKLQENAEKKLNGSLREKYKQNIYMEQLSDNIYQIGIREEAFFIEFGRKSGFMDELLERKSGSEVKQSKDGHKYRIIPFEHTTSVSPTSSAASTAAELKQFLQQKKVPHSKTRALALDEKGSPRIGLIHSFDIKDMRIKDKKGGHKPLSPNLQGLKVFQALNPQTGRVERNIMTFRVISEKHKGQNKWEHPGMPPAKLVEQTYEWLQKEWKNNVFPQLKKKYEGK